MKQISDFAVFNRLRVCVDAVMYGRLGDLPERTKKVVPYSEDVPVVGVGVGLYEVVMNMVHVWGHDQHAQYPVNYAGKHNIRMIELGKKHGK